MLWALVVLFQVDPASTQHAEEPTEVVRFNRLPRRGGAPGRPPPVASRRHALSFLPGGPRSPYTGTRFQIPFDKKDDIRIENSLGGQGSPASHRMGEGRVRDRGRRAAWGRFNVAELWDMDGSDWRFGFPMVYRQGRLSSSWSHGT